MSEEINEDLKKLKKSISGIESKNEPDKEVPGDRPREAGTGTPETKPNEPVAENQPVPSQLPPEPNYTDIEPEQDKQPPDPEETQKTENMEKSVENKKTNDTENTEVQARPEKEQSPKSETDNSMQKNVKDSADNDSAASPKTGLLGKLKKIKPNQEKTGGLFSKLRKPKKEDDMKQSIMRDVDLKEGKVDYDENVMTPDEFSVLEEGENKPEQEEEVKATKPDMESKSLSESNLLDQVVMKVERIEGRMEAMGELNKSFQDRATNLSEEIGELRSSLLEKEKMLNHIESQSKKVTEIFEEVKPENFMRELEKKEEEIAKNQVKIESLTAKNNELKESIINLEKIMEKVKSFENLVDMSEKITEKFSQIEENKKYTSRLASKVENIFSELNNRMKEFKNSIEKVEMNDETIKELMKSVDVMEIKVEKVVTKEELEKKEKELREDINNNKMDLEDRLYDLKDFLEDIIAKSGGIKFLKSRQIVPWRIEMEEKIKQIDKMLKNPGSGTDVNNFKKDMKNLKEEVDDLQEQGKEIEKMEGEIEKIGNQVKGFRKFGEREISRKDPARDDKKETVPKKRRTMPFIIEDKKETSEIPPHLESWLRESFREGYTAEDLKKSLKKSGYNPRFVDMFLSR